MDGRTQRARRNQEATLQALYDLLREGRASISVEEVARRAGVAERTVFRQFRQVDGLRAALRGRVQEEAAALADLGTLEGELDHDFERLLAARVRTFCFLEPFRALAQRVGHPHQPDGRALIEEWNRGLRQQLLAVLGARRSTLMTDEKLEALDAWLSMATWARLREMQQLSPERAARVFRSTAWVLLEAARFEAERGG